MRLDSKHARSMFFYAGIFITILATVFYIYYFSDHVSEIPNLEFANKTVVVGLAAVLLHLAIIISGGTVWFILLLHYKQSIPWLDAQIIYGQSQFGKYLPGNFAHHVGRVVLSRKYGISMPVVVGSMMLETVWAIAVGLAVATVCTIGNAGDVFRSEYGYHEYYVVSAVFAVMIILPYIILVFIKRNIRIDSGNLYTLCQLGLPGVLSLVKVVLMYLFSFLVCGTILSLHARYLFNVDDVNVMLMVGIFAWAWTIGFITPGSPAGLGVRDTVLLAALTPLYGSGVALGLSLSLRLVTTLGDGIWFVISLITPSVVRSYQAKKLIPNNPH